MNVAMQNLMSRFGAGSDLQPARELTTLVDDGRLDPSRPGPRALDLGRGNGENAIYLANHGFHVTCTSYSEVTVRRVAVACAGAEAQPRFVRASLTTDDALQLAGPFDLIVGHGVLDALDPDERLLAARTIWRLTAPGSNVLLWCLYGDVDRSSRSLPIDPEQLRAGLRAGEEQELFGSQFDIDSISTPAEGTRGFACFLMTRC